MFQTLRIFRLGNKRVLGWGGGKGCSLLIEKNVSMVRNK